MHIQHSTHSTSVLVTVVSHSSDHQKHQPLQDWRAQISAHRHLYVHMRLMGYCNMCAYVGYTCMHIPCVVGHPVATSGYGSYRVAHTLQPQQVLRNFCNSCCTGVFIRLHCASPVNKLSLACRSLKTSCHSPLAGLTVSGCAAAKTAISSQ